MTEQDLSREKLIEKLANLHQEITKLKLTERVFQAQNELLRSFVTISKTATGSLMRRSLAQQILNTASNLTQADESNLLLVESDGTVSDSVGTRMASLLPPTHAVVGKSIDGGIAGWVQQFRQIGLISDTAHDDRWKPLPGYSHTTRSVLCIPIFRGHTLLAILTLMHSHPAHFRYDAAHIMKLLADPIASILESATLLVKQQSSHLSSTANSSSHLFPKLDRELPSSIDKISMGSSESAATIEGDLSPLPKLEPKKQSDRFANLGLYIIRREGKFLYVNHQVSALFGYSFEELLEFESILALVEKADFDRLFDTIEQCIRGQNKNIYCQFKAQHKEGRLISVEMCGSRTKFYGKSAIVGAIGLK